MNMHSFFSGFCHSPISRRAAVLLVALALGGLGSCGRKHDTSAGGDTGSGEILEAAKSGDLAKVKALLKGNPDLVLSKDTNGMTPLHFSAQGHKDVAELLLASKAEVNAKDKTGSTPLHHAANLGHKDVAEVLLAYPPCPAAQAPKSPRACAGRAVVLQMAAHALALTGAGEVVELPPSSWPLRPRGACSGQGCLGSLCARCSSGSSSGSAGRHTSRIASHSRRVSGRCIETQLKTEGYRRASAHLALNNLQHSRAVAGQ